MNQGLFIVKREEIIRFFGEKNKYGFLSNFYPSPTRIDGITYPTIEHYFQAMKFFGSDEAQEYSEIIRTQNTANKAKILANQKKVGGYAWKTALNPIIEKYLGLGVKIRPNWEQIKEDIMINGLRYKFYENEYLKQQLLDTNDAILIENSPYDQYWGQNEQGEGLNRLGVLLMQVRREIRSIK